MALNEEERRIVVNLETSKAHKFLEQAALVYNQKLWDIAANRYYYACFHIVTALLIHNGMTAKTHSGLIRLFAQNFVQTGKIDKSYSATLTKLMQLRQMADYNSATDVTEEDVQQFSEAATSFVEAVEKLLK